jgi:hypothetical protein
MKFDTRQTDRPSTTKTAALKLKTTESSNEFQKSSVPRWTQWQSLTDTDYACPYPDDWGSMFLKNIGTHLPDYNRTVTQY